MKSIARIFASFTLLALLAFLPAIGPAHAQEAAAQEAVNAEASSEETVANDTAEAGDGSAAEEAAPFTFPALETIGYATPWQLGFQEPNSPVMKALNGLHYWLTILMTAVVVFVMLLLGYVCVRFRAKRNPVPSKVTHNTLVEVVWTVLPILILIGIAIPTLRLHYGLVYNFEDADMTIKVTGHQWYWSYEYPEDGIAFDSNLKKKEELAEGEPYLLAVDNPVVVPVGKKISIEMTSADVIHSWAIPALGVKRDTVPGRLNQTWFTADKAGIYYGQCSELCGKLHGFMPITVIAVEDDVYAAWKNDAKVKFALQRYGTTDVAVK